MRELGLTRGDEYLLRRYGASVGTYVKMLTDQNRTCAICERPEPKLRRLCLDHDHETMQLRGLLCSECNLGLGRFRDDVTLLLKAAEYLTNTKHV